MLEGAKMVTCRGQRMFRTNSRLLFPLALLAMTLPVFAAPPPIAPAGAMSAPELPGITHWVNSPPLTMQSLRGKVVLVDFWTFECINCLNALPHVKDLYARYKDKGLVVIGVHTPELSAERDTGNLVNAVRRLGIDYPVAQDNDNATWNAWNNQYWPAQYLVDAQGKVVLSHLGEGGYAEMEKAVRAELGLPAQSTNSP
jgi:thiol-disulfide isomerase/thioredoxin